MSPIIIIGLVVLLAVVFFVWLLNRSPGKPHHRTLVQDSRVPSAVLKCIEGPQQGQIFPLQSAQVIIGRVSECHVTIPSDHVSRRHAIITSENNHYVLYDQDSTNGTWVNGQRVAQYTLQPQDQIQIGPDVFVLELAEQAEPTPSPIPVHSPPPEPPISVHDIAEYELLDSRPGGAATVHQARSLRDNQTVALKVLHSQDPYIQDKFVKEIEMGKILRHPHIVRAFGGGNSKGLWYLVMEFMEGGTLRDRMKPGCPAPWDFTLHVMGQMCDALSYAHQRGVYHRDIKPENILFDSNQVTKLGDFGIARLAQSVTRTAHGMLVGTPLYMSFEQAKGHPIDHRTDIYSLGVVLYEMVTGQPPFMAENPLAIVEMHIRERPTPPRQFNRSVSPQVEQVIMRALAKEREQRFQTTEEMAYALGYTAPMHPEGEEAQVSFSAPPAPVETATALTPDVAHASLQLVRFDNVAIPLQQGTMPLNRPNINQGDDRISRRKHAEITYQAGYWWLKDIGSTNGTFVNGIRIFEPVMLQVGDEVRLGNTTLRVAQA